MIWDSEVRSRRWFNGGCICWRWLSLHKDPNIQSVCPASGWVSKIQLIPSMTSYHGVILGVRKSVGRDPLDLFTTVLYFVATIPKKKTTSAMSLSRQQSHHNQDQHFTADTYYNIDNTISNNSKSQTRTMKVNMPSPETFDDEYDDEGLEEQLAKRNAKVSRRNGTVSERENVRL